MVVLHWGEDARWRTAKALVLALREADPWDETFGELLAQVDRRVASPTPRPAGSVSAWCRVGTALSQGATASCRRFGGT